MCAISFAGDLCITSVNLQPVPTPIACTMPAASVVNYLAAMCAHPGPCPLPAAWSLHFPLCMLPLPLLCPSIFSNVSPECFSDFSPCSKIVKHTPEPRWFQTLITTSFTIRIYLETLPSRVVCVVSLLVFPLLVLAWLVCLALRSLVGGGGCLEFFVCLFFWLVSFFLSFYLVGGVCVCLFVLNL